MGLLRRSTTLEDVLVAVALPVGVGTSEGGGLPQPRRATPSISVATEPTPRSTMAQSYDKFQRAEAKVHMTDLALSEPAG
jgi:hypothetical protein